MAIDDEIKAIEDEILKTQKNKATEFHIGKLKAKIARLKQEQEKRRKASGGPGEGFDVKKSGHGSVGLVGLPSVGKSTLLNALTGTESEVGAYHFTTLTVIPGLLEHRNAKIQILDMPGIISGASKGKGRGREVLAVARNVDLIILLVEATAPKTLDVVIRELEDANIRVNQHRPDVVVYKKAKGGLDVQFTGPQAQLTTDYVKDLASEFKIVNADIVVRQDLRPEQVVDAFAGNRAYIPGLLVFSKYDMLGAAEGRKLVAEHEKAGWRVAPVSATTGQGLPELRDAIFEQLNFIRIFLRPQGGEADLKEPLVLKAGSSVAEVCDALHRDFRRRFRYAQVWGRSAKFPGQTVGIDHLLKDEDILTLILRKG
jgi:uncharacterized protein